MYKSLLVLLASVFLMNPAQGQESRKIPISFLPPPLETATYSLGIYNVKSGQLVRRLQEGATQDAFTVGLNGLITNWDGKDDAGKLVPPGKYAARGYAVGALKVEGNQILGNDWAADDEGFRVNSVEAIALVPEDDGLAVLTSMPSRTDFQLARYSGTKHELLWTKLATGLEQMGSSGKPNCFLAARTGILSANVENTKAAYRTADGGEILPAPPPFVSSDPAVRSEGKDGTVWKIESGVLSQYSSKGELLRSLVAKPGEPVPEAVAASKRADRLYLLEETMTQSGEWQQRVRGLSWKETLPEGDKMVSTWETFFENSIHRDCVHVAEEGTTPSDTGITLVENPLSPGKAPYLKFDAACDGHGSYLTTGDGLRLRQISQRLHLREVRVEKGKVAGSLIFYQTDSAAWDEFSIEGVKNMMAFDAGEIDMTTDGEKTHPEKAAEPPDL